MSPGGDGAPALRDDTGAVVAIPARVSRVVSLVPSLTETVAVTAPGLVAGATDWCTHPAGLDVPRVRGTKNPDVAAVIALRPDVVLANEEENRPADLAALRDGGPAGLGDRDPHAGRGAGVAAAAAHGRVPGPGPPVAGRRGAALGGVPAGRAGAPGPAEARP